MNTVFDSRALSVGAAAALIALSGMLLVQHLRHGWPFSLHHGISAPGGSVATSAPKASTSDHAATHPRAAVQLERRQLDAIGVRVEQVREEVIARPIRAVAIVVPDESRLSHVHTRVAGWIEKLYVRTTGERVRAGQPLAAIFSQELLSSQSEFLAARKAAGGMPKSAVLEGARARLQVLGMTESQMRALEQSGAPQRLVTISSPRSGVVLHRGVSVGTAVDPSTELVTVADLSRVWILAELPEEQIPDVRVGTKAVLEFPASGRRPLEAQVAFLSPTLSERTRTLRVRFAVENRDGALRPGLYGTASLQAVPRRALTIPRDAIVDTGSAQHVFVAEGGARFAPRLVQLGQRFEDRVEVRTGLLAGESIAASGVFLIDSESRLRASGSAAGHAHGGEPKGAPALPAHQGH